MKTPAIRMVACDMDGTLLNRDGKISAPTVELVHKLFEDGYIFSIASGRMPHRINKHVASIIPPEHQHYVACNGAIVISSGSVIFEQRFPVAPYRSLVLEYLEKGLEFSFDHDDAYYPLYTSARTQRHAHDVRGYNEPIGTGEEVWSLEINKMSVMDPKDSGLLNGFIQGLRDIGGCSPYQYGVHAAEIAPLGCSKQTGVKRLAEHLGVEKDNVLSIGDHTNDIALLSYTGAGAAVGNASEEVKRAATYICQYGFDEGVAEAIRHYIYR